MSNTFTRDPQPRIQYVGDGVRIDFEVPFPILARDDLLVFLDDQPATGFAVNGLGEPTGEVTFIEPPAAGTAVTLLRRMESIRETEFVDGGAFRAATINAELDRIMLLIQENRDAYNRALRAGAFEGDVDLCLPTAAHRANSLLGFDSSGKPMVFGQTELPVDGNGSGLIVTPSGASTGRALGEHLANIVNVRDFGAIGDGATDDSTSFQAAIAAAQVRSAVVRVPAGPTPYLIGAGLVLDGVTVVGDGPGSMLKLGLANGTAIQLTGDTPGLAALRLLGPGANAWPQAASEVDLGTVALDAVEIAGGSTNAQLRNVEIAACHTGLAIEGPAGAIVDCGFVFCRNGVEIGAGAEGSLDFTRTHFQSCSLGIHATADAPFGRITLAGGRATSCGRAVELVAPATGQRVVEIADLQLPGNLEVDVAAGPRHTVSMRGCVIDDAGRSQGVGVELTAAGETDLAPNLMVENTRAAVTAGATVQLSGGSNLNLLAPGDLIVLATDADDLDDLWTILKADRSGIIQEVVTQTTTSAEIVLAHAADRPIIATADTIRVVGRSGEATVDSVGAAAPVTTFTWLRADDHCRVFANQNPMAADQIILSGDNADLRHFPGVDAEPVAISGVDLRQGAVNGALTRLVTLEIAQDAAVSFTPDSAIGMVQVFGHGSLGDPSAATFTYRADALGYTQLIAGVATVEVMASTALTGTSGNANVFTFSAHTDGKIYVENRLVGPPRTVSLFVVGAPL
ncbi:MAG: glycosyl hydrolase family 28-related protein [Pseudomonadota bacterium]